MTTRADLSSPQGSPRSAEMEVIKTEEVVAIAQEIKAIRSELEELAAKVKIALAC
ncbi:MAG: hypothetical protein JSR99_03495 [Proteobacteria bacterium]|nr:hypothetical protein [Pseudomonadota bacterium]